MRSNRWLWLGLSVAAIFLVVGPAAALDFWSDGNLIATAEATQSGPQRFVVNVGLAEGANRDMVFGSAMARSVGGATALYHDGHRRRTASDVVLLLAQLPATEATREAGSAQLLMGQLGWGASKAGEAAKYLDAFKGNYWKAGTDGAALHNTLSKWLRSISRRTPDGRVLHSVNLKALGDALAVAQAATIFSDVAIGACLRAAVDADLALDRLDVLERALAGAEDPAVRAAMADARRQLENGSRFWGALLEEVNSRQAEFVQMGVPFGLKAAMKAVGAKGTVGLVLVYETIISDWEQHDTAQVAVMAATIEELLTAAGMKATDAGDRCQLAAMAAMARYTYFDRMVEVTSVWQGKWVDFLSKGRPYADAKAYFTEQRRHYDATLQQERAKDCWKVAGEGKAGSCGPVDLALLVDSSGSMQENDPRGLRREAAALLIDRTPPGTTFTVVDFDSSATTVVARSADRNAARAAVARVDAAGGTNIAAALAAGYQHLAFGGGSRAAVLFTDGRSDQRAGAERFIQAGIPVHVVGLGAGVDADYLKRLAASTGGIYMQVARASDLAGAFDQVVAELACEGTVFSRRGTIQAGQTESHRFRVDPLLERLVVRLTWPGSNLTLALIDPGGVASGTTVASGPTYRIVAVDDPQPGEWTARVTGEDVSPGGEPYLVSGGGASDLRLTMAPADPADPTLLRLEAVGTPAGAAVARVWATVAYPDGSVADTPPPTPAGANVWGVAVPAVGAGVYSVTAGIAGSIPGAGNWVREVTRTVVMGEGQIPWRGRVTRVDGGYLTIDRGERHGVRPGMKVVLGPGREPDGEGIVVSIMDASSTVEVQQLFGGAMAREGMAIELDRTQWMGDARP